MSHKILVVEDSPDIRRLVEHILSQAGYEVATEQEGPAGWAAFEQLQPDLVLLDVNLPGFSGLEICRRIKGVGDTPVILLTVRAETEAILQGQAVGADAYLTKPFEIDQLMDTVRRSLRPRIRRLSSAEGESS